jgi:acyl-CoA thioester hydrolase
LKPFTYYLRVRYGECDAQQVVFNARYGDYVDVAVNEFLRALGFEDQLVTGELDFQLVKQTTEWRAPARFDQVLALSVSATRIGTTSFTLTTEFRVAVRRLVEPVPDRFRDRTDLAADRRGSREAHPQECID